MKSFSISTLIIFSSILSSPATNYLHANPNKQEKHLIKDIGKAVKTYLSDTWYITKSPTRINKKSALWLGGITLTSAIIYRYDKSILNHVRRNRDEFIWKPILDVGNTFEPIGYMGNTNKYYFAGMSIGYFFDIPWLRDISAQIIEANFIAGGFKNLANVVVGRRRPNENKGAYNFEFFGGTSFPSGHSVIIFNLATVLVHHVDFWPFTFAAYGTATAVTIQRFESRQHWPSDAFLGAVLGYTVSKAVIKLNENRKFEVKPTFIPEQQTVGLKFSYSF